MLFHSCVFVLTLTQALGFEALVDSVNRTSPAIEYVRESVEVLLRLMDTDRDGAISGAEADDFLSRPGNIPSELREAFTEGNRMQADTNFNDKLERYELQRVVVSLISVNGNRLPLVLIVTETRQLIAKGIIKVPNTTAEVTELTMDTLDTDHNNKISIAEAHAFYGVVSTDQFWSQVQELGAEVDQDGDQELNEQELTAFIELAEDRLGPLTYTPLVIYSRVVKLLGRFPYIGN